MTRWMRIVQIMLVGFGLAIALGWMIPAWADDPISPETCAYNGIPLHGEVQVVDSFPDLKVEVVSSFPDLRVQLVSSFPEDCGQWHFTNSFPDFKIQFVNSFPDLQIQFVDSFPGIP